AADRHWTTEQSREGAGKHMGTMPYWLMKTPEMVAMDHWFNKEDGESALVDHYNAALASMQSNAFETSSDALDNKLPNAPGSALAAFAHPDADWINLQNPTSGGAYWPQVPTITILLWFKHGIALAAKKGLGWSNLGGAAATVFASELYYMTED